MESKAGEKNKILDRQPSRRNSGGEMRNEASRSESNEGKKDGERRG